jgi:hypothetical protein
MTYPFTVSILKDQIIVVLESMANLFKLLKAADVLFQLLLENAAVIRFTSVPAGNAIM